ncbi:MULTISPECIES: hypothetical protein [unclassified Mesorhizobium]|uniref:hypothetical protein n=1 Tax=unclassified Mesorhizobium TaxID=325217 RepID=UPI000FCCA2D0|nr:MULTISPECIES: hypothetical protein [unclassified Mesorhizobium]RUV63531.1 hypothetical protein EOA85_03380 [Mesorhizobium sp. M5C.F.Ca.IN.020.29.1.1]RWA97078.1 MAG: hypothetical protein EOQ33_33035 [Mesorhizobium sp.]RWC10961.1 MAG: hypothetical protein EOS51_22880 [Mesorhizobium sp.]RWD76418.1 MAG: hypothetical protein EOS48_30785 [Mesorhizobium sp.]RWE52863.1 MAG: hypothetical protein EOS67_28965 [Mesorhizobium sp.]
MRFIDLEAILPKIRNLLADLQVAQDAALAEPNAKRRALIIDANQQRWTALRQAFEEASFDKCWYTECRSPGADNDIDHFRPKAKVREDRAHPGYYWLAFDWKNMRLSCQRANRPRIAPGARVAGGKSTHFPLLATGVRARTPCDDLTLEHPALLDPTEPGDPIVLTFRPNGEIDVSPDFRGNAVAVAKVEASRLGLHLNWPKFVEGRLTLYNLVERAVERGRREAPVSFEGWPMANDAFKDAIRDLKAYMDPRAEYSAAAKVYVESFRNVWWINDVVLRL